MLDPVSTHIKSRLSGGRANSHWMLSVDGGETHIVELLPHEIERIGPASFRIDGRVFSYARPPRELWLAHEGWTWHITEATAEDVHDAHLDGELRAPMPGSVLLVPHAAGDSVKAGDAVVVLESMKMELSLTAPVDGTVAEVAVAVGDKVARDQVVARVQA